MTSFRCHTISVDVVYNFFISLHWVRVEVECQSAEGLTLLLTIVRAEQSDLHDWKTSLKTTPPPCVGLNNTNSNSPNSQGSHLKRSGLKLLHSPALYHPCMYYMTLAWGTREHWVHSPLEFGKTKCVKWANLQRFVYGRNWNAIRHEQMRREGPK